MARPTGRAPRVAPWVEPHGSLHGPPGALKNSRAPRGDAAVTNSSCARHNLDIPLWLTAPVPLQECALTTSVVPPELPTSVANTPPVGPVSPLRAIWISDLHLGTPGCQAQYVLDFLRVHECETLFLVGDILDGWQLRKGWYWPQSHNDVVQKLLRKARKGTRVVYVPGNHDELVRQFDGLAFGDIEVCTEAFHTLKDGRRLWVVHGDLFDGVTQHARWLAYLGDSLYTLILKFNQWFNAARARMGLPYWSVSQYLKHQVKNAVNYMAAFEQVMVDEARRRGCQGVVCGHIHKAEIREIGDMLYCNDGDWVESLTALVETQAGELGILRWSQCTHTEKGET